MKKVLILSAIIVLLSFSLVSAQEATRTYQITFENAPEAGIATNPRFFFSFPEAVMPINLAANMSFENNILTIVGPTAINPGESYSINLTLFGPEEILSQLEAQELVYDWEDDFFTGKGITRLTAPPVTLAEIPLLETAKKIGVPLAIGLGGVGVISLGVSAASASANIAYNLAEFFRYIALGFFRFRKRKPWGTVYNKITGKPIAGAIVKLFDTQFQKLKETQITDKEGRFGFLIAPGTYYIKASRNGFEDQQTEVITIKDPNETITLSIPLSSEHYDPEKQIKVGAFWRWLKSFLDGVSIYILIIGTLLSVLVLIISPTLLNAIVFGIYVLLDILKYIIAVKTVKSFGTVLDKEEKMPVNLAVIRIFDADKNWLLNTRVSDDRGRFNFLVVEGTYYVAAAKSGYKRFLSQTFEVSKAGIVDFDIKLEKSTT